LCHVLGLDRILAGEASGLAVGASTRRFDMPKRWVRVLVVALLSAGLAACSSSATPSPSANGSAGSAGGGGGVTFSAQIDFTGFVPLKGSFTDSSTASDASSCSDYANNGLKPVAGWFGPDPNGSTIGGQTVEFSLSVDLKTFHGPATYPGNSFLALKIGSDLYAGGAKSITINADGSGSAAFSDAQASGAKQVESGTITWTCSGG
jgi:hypothetical protein